MNEYNERILKNVLEDVFEEKDKEYLKEIEEANRELKDYRTPEKDEAFYKFLDKEMKKANRKKSLKRAALRAASIIVVICVGFAVLSFTVHGFKEKVWELLTDMTSNTHFSVMISADENTKKLKAYEGKYVPSYIPDGYKVTEFGKNTSNSYISLRKNDCFVLFTEYNVDSNVGIDDEDVIYEEMFQINGTDAVIIKKENITSITMYFDDRIVVLSTNDSQIDVVGFAELIEAK